jgi:cellobiose phosphorylase
MSEEKTGKYGYFDRRNREFVITRPDTPTPWINYLGAEEYCALMSNTAGGYSFHRDPRDRRITRFRYNNIPPDRPGRYIYVRDQENGTYWSATWQPVVQAKRYRYECRHGLGYTKILSESQGIATETTYFVPLQENVEFWVAKVRNTSKKTRKLTLFTYAEFCLWHAEMDMTDFQYTLNIAKAELDGNIIFHETEYAPDAQRFNLSFFASSKKPSGYDCDREAFIGPYRSEADPRAVTEGRSFNSFSSGGNPIASMAIDLSLDPGQEKDVVFILGVADRKSQARAIAKKYKSVTAVIKKLGELKRYWEASLGTYQVKTPDADVDIMVNTWNQYQCRTTFNWSRFASYYEAGIGRGMGFRDSNQDTLGVVHSIPKRVKERIKELAANQFKNGSSYHKFFPLTKTGEKGGYSDDPLWLILAVAGYIKETGDRAFLNERVSYIDGGKGIMYEHLKRAIDFVWSERGEKGFTLMRFADWNDCLNLGTDNERAETTWVPELHYLAIREFLRLADLQEKESDMKKYAALGEKIKRNFNKRAWDGAWFIRGIDKNGKAVGSKRNKKGKIYLNTQAWAVMSGIADEKRSFTCMDMVKKHLDSKYGVMLMAPAYSAFDPILGAITTFAPGLKENGGIFCHSNPWAMIAETILGRGDRAFEYYKKILPPVKNRIADTHQTECYVYSQFITGKDNPHFGRARNSWLTGTAAWNMVAISQYILGIRPEHAGLMVNPCIPRAWKRFTVKRKFRNAAYVIEVRNPKRVSRGVQSLIVDGKRVAGNIIPDFGDKKTHRVEAVLGR